MLNSHASERLSAEDAVFFYLDTKDMPLHIASVMVFDGPIPLEGFQDLILSKLPLVPRYRQRIIVPPFNVGHPTWEPDPAFDIRNHIHSVSLKRGTEAELQKLAGRILSEMMDRGKPLWDMTLVDGLKDGKGALIARVHHCLVDGVAGIAVLNSFFDSTPQAASSEQQQDIPKLPDAGSSLVDALLSSYSEMFERFLSMESAVLNIAEGLATQGMSALDQLVRFVPELLGSVDRLPFNKPCLGPRKLVWTEVTLPEVKAIRNSCGGKLNDVVLTVVTAAIRRYTILHHQPVRGRVLRMMVPVSIRGRDNAEGVEQSDTGNRVSMMPVIVPLDIGDPVKLLDNIRRRTEDLKGSSISEVVRFAGNWVGFMPAPVQALIGPHASSLPSIIPPWNLVCTNVPGPPAPIYAVGRQMLTTYPYVPIGAEMGLNIAIESYNGKLFFGFTGSEAAAPDVAIVPRLLDQAFAELRKAAGIKPPSQPKPPRKAKRAKPSPSAAKPNAVHANAQVPADTVAVM